MASPANLLNRAGTLKRKTQAAASEADGTFDRSNADVTGVRYHINPASGSEALQHERETGRQFAQLHMLKTLTDGTALVIAVEDEFLEQDGTTLWRVRGPAKDEGGMGIWQSCEVERVV